MSDGLALSDFKAALFDVDGTLVDSLGVISAGLSDAFEKFGPRRPTREQILPLVGMPLTEQARRMTDQAPTPQEIEERIRYTIERYQVHKHLEEAFPAALATLDACHRAGIRTALVTSKNARELELFLPSFSHSEIVDAIVGASDVERPKPHPDCVLLACERLGVEPSEAVMIGDSIYDMRSARAAGAATVAVSYGSATRESLVAERPDAIFDSPDQLLEWATNSLLQKSCPERS